MQESGAYAVQQIGACADPLLPSVDCAIVLTMRGSERWRAHAAFLLRLCPVTFLQVNDGFRAGRKPEWVTSSNRDLVHAYAHAFRLASGMGHVLVLEDDAEPMPDDFLAL